MTDNAAAKADRHLIEGHLIVVRVEANRVEATCRGEGTVWHLAYAGGRWACGCPVRTDRCSHLLALRRVVAVDLVPVPR